MKCSTLRYGWGLKNQISPRAHQAAGFSFQGEEKVKVWSAVGQGLTQLAWFRLSKKGVWCVCVEGGGEGEQCSCNGSGTSQVTPHDLLL